MNLLSFKQKNSIFHLTKKSFLLAIFWMIISNVSNAATKTWQPTTGGNWTTAGNWNPSGQPAANDVVIISSNQSANITNVPTISLNTLTISGNCDFEGAASGNVITVTSSFSVAATKTFQLGNGGSKNGNDTFINLCWNNSRNCEHCFRGDQPTISE